MSNKLMVMNDKAKYINSIRDLSYKYIKMIGRE